MVFLQRKGLVMDQWLVAFKKMVTIGAVSHLRLLELKAITGFLGIQLA